MKSETNTQRDAVIHELAEADLAHISGGGVDPGLQLFVLFLAGMGRGMSAGGIKRMQ